MFKIFFLIILIYFRDYYNFILLLNFNYNVNSFMIVLKIHNKFIIKILMCLYFINLFNKSFNNLKKYLFKINKNINKLRN